MRSRITIRDLTAECGERAQGFLTIGETAGGPLRIPVVIVNGADDGPILCLTAGVHATEYAPIDTVMRLVQELRPEGLRGAVIAVPVANMCMFEGRTGFVSPLDGLNLNKIAAGRRDGSISEVLAHVLLEEIIGAAQYHIDLHAGDLGEMLMPFAGYPLTGQRELDEQGEELARVYTPRLISLSTPGSTIPPFADGIVYAATRKGIVSILAESGGNGTLEETDVQIHLDGVRNVMRHLRMNNGRAPVVGPRIAASDRVVVRAIRAGLLRLKVQIGDAIEADQEVAEICNVFGEVVERVRTPRAGIAGLVWARKVVNTGDPIVRYWITAPA
ncbi:MAG: succinylglutamate desuccinylase/aspartoacylase family protein [Gemmatimonadaceae bacterium]